MLECQEFKYSYYLRSNEYILEQLWVLVLFESAKIITMFWTGHTIKIVQAKLKRLTSIRIVEL